MKTERIEYIHENTLLEGYMAYDETVQGKRPAVLIAHDWTGRNDFACQKAEKLAELGYVGFALDMYGAGVLGSNNDEKSELLKPFVDDRVLSRDRMLIALNTLQNQELVDIANIAAMGYCFGGLCVLDLARSGAEVRGVVSFHGILSEPEKVVKAKISAKVLALHGHDDPMVPPEQVAAFTKEMTDANVDWQIHVYGNTLHSFTNPAANDRDFGTVYDAKADTRSWIAARNFFAEVFAS